MTSSSERIDPDTRFQLSGQFDEGAYEEDLRDFPQCFDRNGWPLFGDYDPLALRHPITQEPWHLKPRIPTLEENENPDAYFYWFLVAEDFQNMQTELFFRGRELSLIKPKRQTDVKIAYRSHARKALDANRDYLLNDLMPPLNDAFAERSSSPSFIRLWGEFCKNAGEMDLVFDREKKRKSQRHSRVNIDEQLQWYAHYFIRERQSYKSAIETEEAIARLVNAIVDGELHQPAGFDVGWFETLLNLSESAESNENYGHLADAFTQKRLTMTYLREHQMRPTTGLPPLDLTIPTT